ncbi:MAG: hypothetical protein ACR2JU_14340 [Nocardioidaceae bacterium]
MPGEGGGATLTPQPRARLLGSVLAGAAFALVAFATAPVAALVSRMCWRSSGVTVPYGLALSAAGSMALVALARASSRLHGFVAGGAWLVGLAAVVRSTAGGGFLVAGDSLGWAFLVVDTVGVLAVLLWGGGRR